MHGRQGKAVDAQMWGGSNNSNYDGSHMSHHFLNGTYKISGRSIFVGLNEHFKVHELNT
jgi:hypothetical protein